MTPVDQLAQDQLSQASQPSFPNPLPDILDLGTIALMNGSPNAGKTALLAAILQRMSTGGDVFGIPVAPTPVVYVVMDRPWNSGAGKWFKKYRFDVPYYSFVDDKGKEAKSFDRNDPWSPYLEILESLNLPPGTLIATDPYENVYGDVMKRRMVITASTVMHRYLMHKNYAQLGIMHSGKMRADEKDRYANVHEQMAGTGALSGYSSTQLTLLAPEQVAKRHKLHRFYITSHSLPPMTWEFPRLKNGCFDLDAGQPIDVAPMVDDETTAAEIILGAVNPWPLNTRRRAIQEQFAANYSESMIDKALKYLLSSQKITSPQRGYYCRPAPQ